MTFTAFVCAAVVASCSSAHKPGKVTNGFRTGGVDGGQLVRRVGYSSSVVRPERRFAGLIPGARHVSVVDPQAETEVFGRDYDGDFISVAPLPSFSGAALFSARAAAILAESGNQAFPDATFDFAALAAASQAAAFAAIDSAGGKIRVLRAKTGGLWQDWTFDLPWAGEAPTPSASTSGPNAVSLLSGDGTRLVAFRPTAGDFVLYAAASAASDLAGPTVTCPAASLPVGSADFYRSAAWHDASGSVILGDRNGRVSVLDPNDCPANGALPHLDLPDQLPITNVTVAGDGIIGVTQAGGKAYTLTYVDGALTRTESRDTCRYPLGFLRGDGVALGVVCFAVDFDPKTDPDAATSTVSYSTVSLQVWPSADAATPAEVTLDEDNDAGIAFDASRGVLLELRDSALGILKVTTPTTGVVREKRGLFLKGVLD